jgi:hypothetical protein
LADAFAAVPDPRSPRGRWHPLVAILLIAACATTCDADGVTAIWQWVDDADERVLARLRVRRDPWSGRRVPPSERTIQRVLARLARLDPQTVQDAAGAFLAGRLAAAGLVRPPPVREREQRRAQGRDRCRPRGGGHGIAVSASTARSCVGRGAPAVSGSGCWPVPSMAAVP